MLINFLTNGGLVKLLSIVFLFLLATCALVVAGIEILQGQTPSPYIISVLTVAAGTASTIVGVHIGRDMAGPPTP